ncbi:hypothetical protein [Agrobacterium tumefaciens]|uniref:hypothetical protein n=1 Tax=Agrobacterium tumefaciens TaxID=358 RepID=UPI000EF18F44|nr:hypothetical protein [Agrobacterium tumefaciens]AYM08933.1 hypothetical protein At1D1460_46920 [Agrobacterium tumefaciens]NSZ35733.1 hypothetical protein [Agrobacterium tumefaciens]QLG25381.1 hypothetical protein EML4_23655 [Agrobacterium tumefaciens]UXS89255.1 hypothetical protein FY144_23595 [Agrobacterium tumefaciens]
MHIAVDDTYGPEGIIPTKYVTGARRTYVAVEFPDEQVSYIRENIRNCVTWLGEQLGTALPELHFSEIYNRRGPWKGCTTGVNLRVISFFAEIYRIHQWQVHVQTVDDRTFADHNFDPDFVADGIDLSERDGRALFLLLLKVKDAAPPPPEPLVVRVDAGRQRAGTVFAPTVFREWGSFYDGSYQDSHVDPLLQMADFLAFCVNRCTHLATKQTIKELDIEFLHMIAQMRIQSEDIKQFESTMGSIREDFDRFHFEDRVGKGLESPK